MHLETRADTFLKQAPKQSEYLPKDNKVFMKEGETISLKGHEPVDDSNHVKLYLAEPLNGITTWYMFAPHVYVEGTELGNFPQDEEKVEPKGPVITVPGKSEPVGLNDPIIAHGNFTWSEFTKGGSRIPENFKITQNIIKMAEVMEEVRERLGGKPLTINSAYRPPHINRAVGGASMSRHLWGDAVDFVAPHLSMTDAYWRLESWWGDRGGLAKFRGSEWGFVHIDGRGYKVRFSY